MVQLFKWFKSLFKKREYALLNYNVAMQQESIAKSALRLNAHASTGVFKELESVFIASRNIQLMELGISNDVEDFKYQKGRLDALQDVVEYFALCRDDKQCERIRVGKAHKTASIHSIKGRE